MFFGCRRAEVRVVTEYRSCEHRHSFTPVGRETIKVRVLNSRMDRANVDPIP